ncbi:copper resistance protein B [Caulobacter sp. 1776]|uniref:copper resistance protein B n=1 Tax=Caulobacter sp. 1776 TaxID=3156420 RepID=UPI00339579A0
MSQPRTLRAAAIGLACAVALPMSAFAQEAERPSANPAAEPPARSEHQDHGAMAMPDMESVKPSGSQTADMGRMQGGHAPADARNPDDYSDGYANSTLPNYEMADRLSTPKVLVEELEFVSGNEGQGANWSFLVTKGQDADKLWIRSQGLKTARERLDPESSAELLWWHSRSPFWGTLLGVRQDIGKGATTWLAVGLEGLAPYWFDVQLTGYAGDDGRIAGRFKASYDVRLGNRLILSPQVESNIYSKPSRDRELGSGLSNVELGGRLRYEVTRKFAPYVGFVWERAFGGTADFRRADGGAINERRVAAGVRLWW